MDDWSLLPSRNAESEPAPDPPSTMTTTTLPASLTRPRQAPPTGAEHPWPQSTALDPAGLVRQPGNQSGAKPQNPNKPGAQRPSTSRTSLRTSNTLKRSLDNTRPFMDDIGASFRIATVLRAIQPGGALCAGCVHVEAPLPASTSELTRLSSGSRANRALPPDDQESRGAAESGVRFDDQFAAYAGGSGARAVRGVSPSHRGRACSARRSRASRTSWSRSAPAGRPR